MPRQITKWPRGVATETHAKLRADVSLVRSRGSCFGVKLVRGAYIAKEREMARVQGHSDPVHDCYDGTTRMYYQSAEFMLENVAREPGKFMAMIASHNEDTVQHVIHKMDERGLRGDEGSLVFGQSYGMCDYLSSTLGQAGYVIYKSIPYGSIDDCLPYLHRRALENSSALGAVQKERQLLWKAFVARRRARDNSQTVALNK